MKKSSILTSALIILHLFSCSEKDGIQIDEDRLNIEIYSGNSQITRPSGWLGEPLVVKVTDTDDIPQVGVPVVFHALDGIFNGGFLRDTITSDTLGLASIYWQVSEEKKPQYVQALSYLHDGKTVELEPSTQFKANVITSDSIVVHYLQYFDFQIVVDQVYSLNPGYTEFGTNEFYYGASSYYYNFDLRISKRAEFNIPLLPNEDPNGVGWLELSADDATQIIDNRIKNEAIKLVLKANFPNALKITDGKTIAYWIYFDVFTNEDSGDTYQLVYECTKSAPNPEFELIEF
ncbi:MAG: hypothetical protein ABJN36_06175 [Cyclobacteriaceae bacterium]